jgi:hypothetical protein
MKSGMLAAESTFQALKDGAANGDISSYQKAVEDSWIWPELKAVRNYQPSFQYGLLPGLLYSGFSGFILKGAEPWTFHNTKRDSEKVCVLPLQPSVASNHVVTSCLQYIVCQTDQAGRGVQAHRLPQARWRSVLQLADQLGALGHQPRGRPAVAPAY